MAVKPSRARRPRPPLDPDALERAALHYAERYATTRAKLASYLRRKVRERGWEATGEPPIDSLVERMASLGYVNDRAFAEARTQSLSRRGYGERRVDAAMRAAGVDEADREAALEAARSVAWSAALRFAERRRIGPFARAPTDRAAMEKALAAMLRAGHSLSLARRIVAARPGEVPEARED